MTEGDAIGFLARIVLTPSILSLSRVVHKQ
jgi:hypothetical protein